MNKIVIVYDSTKKEFNKEGYGNGCPTNPIKFLKFVESKVCEIPIVYMKDAYIYFEAEQFYDTPVPTLIITYSRPYTQEEIDEIHAKKAEALSLAKDMEYAKFYELKEKYNL